MSSEPNNVIFMKWNRYCYKKIYYVSYEKDVERNKVFCIYQDDLDNHEFSDEIGILWITSYILTMKIADVDISIGVVINYFLRSSVLIIVLWLNMFIKTNIYYFNSQTFYHTNIHH